jgi:hypothetical protein
MAGHTGRQRDVRGGRRWAHQVKLTDAQERQLQRLARVAGVSPVRFMVEAALSSGRVTRAERRLIEGELVRLRGDHGRVGSLLNQLAHWAHVEQRFPGHVEDTLERLNRVEAAIDETLRELRAWS